MLASGLQDIKDGRADIQDAVKAMQAALIYLTTPFSAAPAGDSSTVESTTESLIKDDEFKDTPPYLFSEHFALVVKE